MKYSIIATAALLLVGFASCNAQPEDEELLMVLEVSRHGAREPSKIYNLTVDPKANFKSTGNLMPMGKKQHF